MEQRKFPRYKCLYEVAYKIRSGRFFRNRAKTENISRGGLRLNVRRLFKEGEIIKLKIFTSSVGGPVIAEAKVVWTMTQDAIKDSGTMGIVFTRIGWTDAKRLLVMQ